LAVTFTNKAAGELKRRLERLAGPELTRDLWVGTFHAICARLLRRYHEDVGLERGFSIYDETDQRALLVRVQKELGFDEKSYPPRWVLSLIHGEKREGRSSHDVDPRRLDANLRAQFKGYEAALAKANAVDFEDLILHVMTIAEDPKLRSGEELRARFRHVLVDEFQDTNTTQYRLVRALSQRTRNLCVVGDDDQSIYRWRGANVRIIRGFRRDFSDAAIVKLEQNYRSTANIVAAALAVIEPAREREPKQLWTAAEAGAPVVLRAVDDEHEEARFVVRAVRTELARAVDAGSIAVFYRVHAQSRVLEEAFRAANLPYQIVGGMKFFERAEVKDLLAYLRLIDNLRSEADLLRIINVPVRGIGQKTVDRLLDVAAERGLPLWEAIEPTIGHGDLNTGAQKKLAAFRDLIAGLRAQAAHLPPHELAEHVLERTGYRHALEEEDSATSDARLENLAELKGSLLEYEEQARAMGSEPTLGEYLERVSLISAPDTLEDAPKVSLMTVHSAKGLEFTTVFITGMEEEIFPYRGIEGDAPEELDEERRLAYVAVTRARERLFITHASARTLFGKTRYLQPSRFISDLPPEAIVREGAPARRYSSLSMGWQGRAKTPARRPVNVAPGERWVDREAFSDIADQEAGEALRPGDRVLHRTFGEGVVERVELGLGPTVVARFGDDVTRKIKAQFLERA
jgi:DNA helicase-2/ATP-dependent DNA helicase PcrA